MIRKLREEEEEGVDIDIMKEGPPTADAHGKDEMEGTPHSGCARRGMESRAQALQWLETGSIRRRPWN